jgi:hypothetical protein
MPRCFSTSIQSDVAWRALLRAFTVPASWIAPPNSSSFSVSVVLPASGWEMMANVRRLPATSRSRSGLHAPTVLLWLQSGGCGGCSMSLLCADTTDFHGQLRDAGIDLLWHPSLSLESGVER